MILLRIIAFTGFALLAAAVAAQDSIDLTPAQARALATRAVLAGNPQLGLELANALLAQNPDDRGALLVVAAAATRLGDPERGRKAAARAFALSTTDPQKYEAARLAALAAVGQERFTFATYWLRRALIVAPDDDARATTLNDARNASARNPWSTSLSFSLTPSSNINGGADEEDLIVAGNDTGGTISADGVALEGWRATFGLGTQYRFQEASDSRSTIGLSYLGGRVRITEETDVTDEALRTDNLQFRLSHQRALTNGTFGVALSAARVQYRDFELSSQESTVEHYDSARLTLDRRLLIGDNRLLTLSVTRERLVYSVEYVGQVDHLNGTVSLDFILGSGDRLGLALTLGKAASDNLYYVSREQGISVSYRWSESVGIFDLSASAGVNWRQYPDYLVFDFAQLASTTIEGGRQDRRVFGALNIGVPEWDIAGFTPGLRIDAARSFSNFSRYDYITISAGFTISSSF
ncbi:MAG: hypothetical protein ACSHW1_12795 [Yoonia sp.]|uniref:hypothetical protein n=1 Tax=Yoonia sp. TaxID=2212373 RepID=UPI003EF83C59